MCANNKGPDVPLPSAPGLISLTHSTGANIQRMFTVSLNMMNALPSLPPCIIEIEQPGLTYWGISR
jgi:hypothetical protein